jgi:hypothetical protein
MIVSYAITSLGLRLIYPGRRRSQSEITRHFDLISGAELPDVAHGSTPRLFGVETKIRPVVLTTENGFVLVEFNDSNWIRRSTCFPDDNVSIETITQIDVSSGRGRHPIEFLDEIRTGISWRSFQARHINKVSVHWNGQNLAYHGKEGEYYNPTTGRSLPTYTSVDRISIPILFGIYLVQIDTLDPGQEIRQCSIAGFDSVGRMRFLYSFGNASRRIVQVLPLKYPLSLTRLVENSESSIELLTSIQYTLVDSALLQMCRDEIPIANYSRPPENTLFFSSLLAEPPICIRNDICFVLGGPPVPIPRENLSPIEYPIEGYSSIVVYRTSNNEVVLTGINSGGRTIEIRRVQLQPEDDSDDNRIVWHGSVVSPRGQDPLLRSIEERVQDEYEMSEEEIPLVRKVEVRTEPIVRLAFGCFMAHVYGLPLPCPEMLDGHLRISYEDSKLLFDREEVVRCEVDPVLQPFAGPPGTLNRILTILTLKREKYFTVCQYDYQTSTHLPPE